MSPAFPIRAQSRTWLPRIDGQESGIATAAAAAKALEEADREVAAALNRPFVKLPSLDSELSAPTLRLLESCESTCARGGSRKLDTFQEYFWSPNGSEDRSIWRGRPEMYANLHRKDCAEFARHRHSITMHFGSKERENARRKRQLQRYKKSLGQKAEEQEQVDERLGQGNAGSRFSQGAIPGADGSAAFAARSSLPCGRRSSLIRSFSFLAGQPIAENDEGNLKHGLLSKLVLKKDKQTRLRTLRNRGRSRARDQQQRHQFEARVVDFNSKAPEDRLLLKTAFKNASNTDMETDSEPTNPYDDHITALVVLNSSDIIPSIVILGITAESDWELRELRLLCEDIATESVDFIGFVYEVLPRIRSRLRDMRRASLKQAFSAFDTDGSGYLSQGECVAMLEKHCASNLDTDGFQKMQAAFQGTVQNSLDPTSGEVSFDCFEDLVSFASERSKQIMLERREEITKQEGLRPITVKEFDNELLWMFDMFKRAADNNSKVSLRGTKRLLIEYGLLPSEAATDEWLEECSAEPSQTVCAILRCLSTPGATVDVPQLTFKEYLDVAREMRRFRREEACECRRALFRQVDRDNSGQLSMPEVFSLIAQLGLGPSCRDEQLEMRQLIGTYDEDESNELNFEEFEGLVQELRDRMHREERKTLWRLAARLEIQDSHVFVCREAVHKWGTDGGGCISLEGIRTMIDRLRMEMSGEELSDMLKSCDLCGRDKINIVGFIQFAHSARVDFRRLSVILDK